MRILFTVHTAHPDFIGGREHHVHGLARGLGRRGHHVTVLAGGTGSTARRLDMDGYTLQTLPMWSVRASREPLQIYRYVPGFSRHLRAEAADLVHTFEYGSYTTQVAAIHAARRGVPLLLTVYGYLFNRRLLRLGKRAYDWTYGRWLLSRAERIYYSSDDQLDELLAAGRSEKLKPRLIWQPNSFRPLQPACADETSRLKRTLAPDGALVIMAVARILPRKGLDVLISALHRLRRKGTLGCLRLVVVGADCGSLARLKHLVQRYGLQRRVTFTGEVPYSEVGGYLHLCDMFVLPSIYEGLPLALLEAMAAGKPAIFTDIPSARRVMQHGEDVLLVPPGDADALANAITALADDGDLRRRLGAAARETASRYYFEQEVSQLEQDYRDVLEAHGKSR
jgi:glycosyltransferase involved in cell wall biosynthesis